MEPHVRRVRRASSHRGPSKFLTVVSAAVALVLIVVLIDFFFSPPRPWNPVAPQGGAAGGEVGGTTNAVPQPRSHLIY